VLVSVIVDVAALQLPEVSNGDVELGIASGIDDIDEPYAILCICSLPKTRATNILKLVQAVVNVKLSGTAGAPADLDVIKSAMNHRRRGHDSGWQERHRHCGRH
jgi:hypothetical protein